MLGDRYQNDRMIARAFVNAIAVQKPLTQETTEDLRQLLKTVEEQSLALEIMLQPVKQKDTVEDNNPNLAAEEASVATSRRRQKIKSSPPQSLNK